MATSRDKNPLIDLNEKEQIKIINQTGILQKMKERKEVSILI
jgi:hypothetical protein